MIKSANEIYEKGNKLAEMLIMLGNLEDIADHADADYEANPESEEFENAFDAAYEAEFNCYMECCARLQDLVKIDFMAAKMMIKAEREKVLKILSKLKEV